MTNILIRSTIRFIQSNFASHVKCVSTKQCVIVRKVLYPDIIRSYRKGDWDNNRQKFALYTFGFSIPFLSLFKSDEEKEPEVIMTIKRSILLMQREEYKKAEQMLHIALKQAQDLQNSDAVTYIYDLMANLAFITEDYKKAETLFVNVMQRLMSNGVPQNDLRIIHMSLKMAKMYEQQGDLEKAENGYEFCLKHLQESVNEGTRDIDTLTFYAITMDWYARMLVRQAKYAEAYKYFLKIYDVSVMINGEIHNDTIIVLNDLGTVSCLQGNYNQALDYLQKAIEIGKQIPDVENMSVIHVNLGNVYIKKNMYQEAKKWCKEGWKIARSANDDESLKEAKICLDEVNKVLP